MHFRGRRSNSRLLAGFGAEPHLTLAFEPLDATWKQTCSNTPTSTGGPGGRSSLASKPVPFLCF